MAAVGCADPPQAGPDMVQMNIASSWECGRNGAQHSGRLV
jgi:hypothetical protein